MPCQRNERRFIDAALKGWIGISVHKRNVQNVSERKMKAASGSRSRSRRINHALDPESATALWKKSEEMVGESFAGKLSETRDPSPCARGSSARRLSRTLQQRPECP
jgi:hypothetical protein